MQPASDGRAGPFLSRKECSARRRWGQVTASADKRCPTDLDLTECHCDPRLSRGLQLAVAPWQCIMMPVGTLAGLPPRPCADFWQRRLRLPRIRRPCLEPACRNCAANRQSHRPPREYMCRIPQAPGHRPLATGQGPPGAAVISATRIQPFAGTPYQTPRRWRGPARASTRRQIRGGRGRSRKTRRPWPRWVRGQRASGALPAGGSPRAGPPAAGAPRLAG